MKLQVEPTDLDQGAKDWLPIYIRDQFDNTVRVVREYLPNLPADPWTNFTGLLVVCLHWGNVPYNNGFVSGLHSGGEHYRGFSQLNAYSRIDINWIDEYDNKRFTLQHEIQNMLNFHCGGNPNLGYGTPDDPAIVVAKAKLDALYHGDVRLYHIRNADQDL